MKSGTGLVSSILSTGAAVMATTSRALRLKANQGSSATSLATHAPTTNFLIPYVRSVPAMVVGANGKSR